MKTQGYTEARELMDATAIGTALDTMADAIVSQFAGEDWLLVGIRTGGHLLAQRLQTRLQARGHADVPLGAVDITLYRDDVFNGLPRPQIGPTELPSKLEGKTVILVDDVLYTGRTVRAALDALNDYGRPKAIRLAVLIDRNHRELPIAPDVVGSRVDTAASEAVQVSFSERGELDRAVLLVQETPRA